MPAASSPKALKLLAEGRVAPDSGPPPQLFHVQGDHGRYVVVVGATVAMCSCPARGNDCSHIIAAAARMNASDGALALMDEALELRREPDRVDGEAAFTALLGA